VERGLLRQPFFYVYLDAYSSTSPNMDMIDWQLKDYNALTVDELYTVMQLRQAIFVVEQNCPYLDADGKDVDSMHLMGYSGGELVAYCRIVKPGIELC
jgi:predicted GNAT family N-acyltransferase